MLQGASLEPPSANTKELFFAYYKKDVKKGDMSMLTSKIEIIRDPQTIPTKKEGGGYEDKDIYGLQVCEPWPPGLAIAPLYRCTELVVSSSFLFSPLVLFLLWRAIKS